MVESSVPILDERQPAMSTSLKRFTKAERLFHWSNAAAVLGLFATGLPIWLDLDKWRPGGWNVLMLTHVWLFGALMIAGALAFVIARRERIEAAAKRFNPGQKVNMLAFQVLLAYMAASGIVRYVGKSLGMTKQTLHMINDWHFRGAVMVGLFLVGHLAMVFLVPKNRGIVNAMTTGEVDPAVAQNVAPQWVAALPRPESGQAEPAPVVSSRASL
jgi:cytochrome b subunit of formate dehydrogenase